MEGAELELRREPPLFPATWASAWGEDGYGYWQAFELNGVRQVMRWIPPGQFQMGSPTSEAERHDDETPHMVTISRGFWFADTACTQQLWLAVMGDNPSHFEGDEHRPVDSVSWDDSHAFIDKANKILANDLRLKLPTEAQWEYACRAGTSTPFSFGEIITTEQANYDGNFPYSDGAKGEFRRETLSVLEFPPNPWGLYQMHGNLWEWCADWYGKYEDGPQLNPKGADDGTGRVLRGGYWLGNARYLRSAYRFHNSPGIRGRLIGLRLAGG